MVEQSRDPLRRQSAETPASSSQQSPHESDRETLRAHHEELAASAVERHDALTTAIEALEHALAEAAVRRERPWSERASHALARVRETIRAHVEGVEELDGLFDEIERVEPRMSTRIASLRREHESLSERASALAARFASPGDLIVADLRSRASKLLSALRAHRAAEIDMTYEAFWTETGGGD